MVPAHGQAGAGGRGGCGRVGRFLEGKISEPYRLEAVKKSVLLILTLCIFNNLHRG
jgi:hypothetical protein